MLEKQKENLRYIMRETLLVTTSFGLLHLIIVPVPLDSVMSPLDAFTSKHSRPRTSLISLPASHPSGPHPCTWVARSQFHGPRIHSSRLLGSYSSRILGSCSLRTQCGLVNKRKKKKKHPGFRTPSIFCRHNPGKQKNQLILIIF